MSNINVPLLLAGENTPRVVIYKDESHKLHEAFNVKDSAVILKGMPVSLTTEGTIEPYTGADGQIYLGVAVTDSINPAYKEQRNYSLEVTVAVEAYMTCNYVAKAAMDCGYVKPTGNLVNNHFIEVEASTDETKFICISPAEEANEVVRVLIR